MTHVAEIIRHLKDEKNIDSDDITFILTKENFKEHMNDKTMVKYFYWRQENDLFFKKINWNIEKPSCIFIYDGKCLVFSKGKNYMDRMYGIKRMFDHMSDSPWDGLSWKL